MSFSTKRPKCYETIKVAKSHLLFVIMGLLKRLKHGSSSNNENNRANKNDKKKGDKNGENDPSIPLR